MEKGEYSQPHAKILNLQILRFIAALGVLVSHAADLTLPRDAALWSLPWTAGVDVFFVISGMIMTILTDGRFGRPGAAREFLTRRIIRIVPIYWLFTALMIATVILLPGQVRNSQADGASIVTSLLFVPWPRDDGQIVPILAQGWTLNYEAFFYLAFALALLHRRGLVFLAAGFAALAMLHAAIPISIVAAHFWSDPIIFEFVAGIGLAKLWLGGVRLRPAATTILVTFGLLLFATAEMIGLHQYGRMVANGVPATMLCAAFLFTVEPAMPGPVRRAFAAGGDASYALYLSHTFTINAVVLEIGGRVTGWVTMAMAIAAAIAASIVTHRLVERPMLRALHRRFADRTAG